MATFIGQLIGFAVIVLIIMKYVVPPVRKMMAERKDTVRAELQESALAAQRVADADRFHAQRVEEGRLEASRIIEEASSDAIRIGEQLRMHGGLEAERIEVQGNQQLLLARSQLIRELRGELGIEALGRATEIIKAHVSDPVEQAATVDRFLDEVESMEQANIATGFTSTDLRPASRDAQAAVVDRFEGVAATLSIAALSQLGGELGGVHTLLLRESTLARYLAQTGGVVDVKQRMLEQLFGSKVGSDTLTILSTAVSERWSSIDDFVDCVMLMAKLSLLERADREQQTDEVAEQLFRFGRFLAVQPRLTALLSDYRESSSGRVQLVRSVLNSDSSVIPITTALLVQTVELLHGERVDEAVQKLAQLAVVRRGEMVAEVGAAADLTAAQRRRLTDILTRIYGHPVSVRLNLDPGLLGGLSIAVGDEVINGALSFKLATAAAKLPS